MEESILEIYEYYFKNDNWRFSIGELSSHKCFFCENTRQKYRITCDYKQDMVNFVIMYLNHLKIYGSLWKKVNYFITSIKRSNFCDDNKAGQWRLEYWYEKDVYILRSV